MLSLLTYSCIAELNQAGGPSPSDSTGFSAFKTSDGSSVINTLTRAPAGFRAASARIFWRLYTVFTRHHSMISCHALICGLERSSSSYSVGMMPNSIVLKIPGACSRSVPCVCRHSTHSSRWLLSCSILLQRGHSWRRLDPPSRTASEPP